MPKEQAKKTTSVKTTVGKKDTLSQLQTLPQAVQDFVLDEERAKATTKIIEKFKLTSEQEDLFFDITDKVIFKELKLEDFSTAVQKEFGFDEKKTRDLSLEILGNVFLPLDSYLGDVSEIIKKLGGDLNKFTAEHIVLEKISAEELTDKILKESGIVVKDSGVKRRLKNIIVNRFNEVRDDEDTVAIMMRGNKVGGVGLSEELAKKIIRVVKAKMGAFQITEVAERAVPTLKSKPRPVANTLPKVPDNLPIAPKKVPIKAPIVPTKSSKPAVVTKVATKPKNSEVIYGVEEEREIAHIRKELKKKTADEVIDFKKEIDKSIQNILKKGKLTFSDDNLEQKFLGTVSARLRDVRDKSETLDILMRRRSVGGLGLGEENAHKVLNLIEDEVSSLGQVRKQGELKKLEEWKKTRNIEKDTKKETEQQNEDKNFEERWTKLTGKSASPEESDVEKVVAQEPVKLSPEVLEAPAPKPLAPTPTPKISPQTSPVPQKPSPVPPPQPVIKPKVEDVKFTPRLTGPIEELRKITINDFRQLSKNPKDATEKIKDKIEILEDESYTKKVEGT
ncbi:MAG: hypothetical protein HQ536_04425, partial [Parcubacteria group bacterium]|nr:hypothetical protein [Parcubacteria group bacterium]